MAEVQAREAKLIQYLNEAYGKEKELETALQAHIQMTTRDSYKKRLRDHLKETKAQSKGLARRIKQLGGKAEAASVPGPDVVSEAATTVQSVANKAVAAAQGPLHALRGTSEPETMLKNAKTEYWNEAEEIANYNAIETLAEAVGDKETVKLARQYRREEERMASFLERTIPQLTKEVVKTEIPASQRNGGKPRRRSRSSGGTSRRGSASSSGNRSRAAASRSSSSRSSSSRSSKSSGRTSGRTSSSRASGSRASSGRGGSKGSSARGKSRASSSSSRAGSSRSGSSGSRGRKR
jgi:ferritin-like metal-binding protein YciE